MKARLIPVFFPKSRDEEFDNQLARLNELIKEEAEFLQPVALGSALPEADAVVFPQLVGDAYKGIGDIKKIKIP
ncbi:MAG TPA: hypothetical protein VMZ05_10335, partial [Spirochaetota bacterium]|nr:hypothetical protein [Spirochaetota bacterium]